MDWQALSRRRFLVGMLTMACAGLPLSACSRGQRAVGRDGLPLLFLRSHEAAALHALADALIPPQPGFPDADQAGVVRRVDEELHFVGPALQADVRAALGVLDLAPLLYGHARRYAHLGLIRHRDVVLNLMNSRLETLRAVGINLKILVHFFYFGHPATWSAIGYHGPFSRQAPKPHAQRGHYARLTQGTGP